MQQRLSGQSGSSSASDALAEQVAGPREREGDVRVQALEPRGFAAPPMPSSSDAPPSRPSGRRRARADARCSSVARSRLSRELGLVARARSLQRSTPPGRLEPRDRRDEVAAGERSRSSGTARRRRRTAPARSRPGAPNGQRTATRRNARGAPAELALDERAVVHRAEVSRASARGCAPPRRDALDDEEALARLDEPEPPRLARERLRASSTSASRALERALLRAASCAHLGRALARASCSRRRGSSRAAGSRGARAATSDADARASASRQRVPRGTRLRRAAYGPSRAARRSRGDGRAARPCA